MRVAILSPMSGPGVHNYGQDRYTEADSDDDTQANLGPASSACRVWSSVEGPTLTQWERNPTSPGWSPRHSAQRVRRTARVQPIDAQTNGRQLLYGPRYHTHIVKRGEVETFHDQVGYWLREPAAHMILHTLAIPRRQVVPAAGAADADANQFEVRATLGSDVYGIVSNLFMDTALRTVGRVTVHQEDTWS